MMKKYGKYVVSYATALVFFLGGLVLEMKRPLDDASAIAFFALLILSVALFALNIVLGKRCVRKLNQTKVADMQSYMLQHRKEAEGMSGKLLSQLRRLRGKTVLYTLFVGVLAACMAFLGGILYRNEVSLYIGCLICSGVMFLGVYNRIPNYKMESLDADTPCLVKAEYPKLYALAERAAEQLGCTKDITLILSLDCNATVLQVNNGKKCLMQIGVVLLNIMTEEELYCIFLHEFSHLSAKNQQSLREHQYHRWLNTRLQRGTWVESIADLLFLYPDIRYNFRFEICCYAHSVVEETEADRDMVRYGDTKAAASSLLKLKYETMRFWESGVKNEEPFYKPEVQPTDYLHTSILKFKNAIQERQTVWNALVDQEILANNASHPTLKMRLKTLGVEQLQLMEDNSSQVYREETQKALDFAEKKLYDENKKSYAKDRQEHYLEPLKRIEEWEQNGCPITAENYADIITDLKQLGRHADAEALCDRAIKELNENSTMHAYFVKGCAMLYRYDEKGMELIYYAIEHNQNYLEEGLETIGRFCCYTNREEELLEFRRRAVQLQQKNKDENSQADFLSKNDKLTKENLPDGMLEDILSFIHSVDCDIIKNIYLVRKTISETFFTSVFVIHFYGGTDAQQQEIMHKIFRYLDSYPVEWQFSLFDYFEFPNVKVEKIEGSLVYSKSKKGE